MKKITSEEFEVMVGNVKKTIGLYATEDGVSQIRSISYTFKNENGEHSDMEEISLTRIFSGKPLNEFKRYGCDPEEVNFITKKLRDFARKVDYQKIGGASFEAVWEEISQYAKDKNYIVDFSKESNDDLGEMCMIPVKEFREWEWDHYGWKSGKFLSMMEKLGILKNNKDRKDYRPTSRGERYFRFDAWVEVTRGEKETIPTTAEAEATPPVAKEMEKPLTEEPEIIHLSDEQGEVV